MIKYISDLCTEKFQVVVRGNTEELVDYLNLYSLNILECIYLHYQEFMMKCGFDNIRCPIPETTLFQIGKTYSGDGISVTIEVDTDNGNIVANVTLAALMPDEEATNATIISPKAVNADLINFK